METNSNQAWKREEAMRAIQPIQNCITNLILRAPQIIHIYPNKVITLTDPVYQKEIDKMVAYRDEMLQSYLSKPTNNTTNES